MTTPRAASDVVSGESGRDTLNWSTDADRLSGNDGDDGLTY